MNEQVIGANIRKARQEAGWTLTLLAHKSELTKSTLSKIEMGQTSTPVGTLLRIAGALSRPLAEFFVEPRTDPPYVVTRKNQGQVISRDGSKLGYSYEALALGVHHKLVEPFLLTICPGDPEGEFRHAGHEFIHMLGGRLGLTIGDDELSLGPGDSLYFDSSLVHKTRVVGKSPARFLCLFIQDRPNAADPTAKP